MKDASVLEIMLGTDLKLKHVRWPLHCSQSWHQRRAPLRLRGRDRYEPRTELRGVGSTVKKTLEEGSF